MKKNKYTPEPNWNEAADHNIDDQTFPKVKNFPKGMMSIKTNKPSQEIIDKESKRFEMILTPYEKSLFHMADRKESDGFINKFLNYIKSLFIRA